MRKVIVAIACAGFAGSTAAELIELKLTSAKVIEKRLTVAPGKFAELCSTLQRGHAVSWQFRTDAATDFNIHYHVDKRVEYPEQRKRATEASGRLAVVVDQHYCWMWTNVSTTLAVVEVHLELLDR